MLAKLLTEKARTEKLACVACSTVLKRSLKENYLAPKLGCSSVDGWIKDRQIVNRVANSSLEIPGNLGVKFGKPRVWG